MDTQKSWIKFMKSGKVGDYLSYVNSCKEKEISEGSYNSVHNGCFSDKGCGSRGE